MNNEKAGRLRFRKLCVKAGERKERNVASCAEDAPGGVNCTLPKSLNASFMFLYQLPAWGD